MTDLLTPEEIAALRTRAERAEAALEARDPTKSQIKRITAMADGRLEAAQSTIAELEATVGRLREANDALQEALKKVQAAYAAVDSPPRDFPAPAFDIALNTMHDDCNNAAHAFWQYWRENGETHKHGYYESTWGAINRALRMVGVREHKWPRAALGE